VVPIYIWVIFLQAYRFLPPLKQPRHDGCQQTQGLLSTGTEILVERKQQCLNFRGDFMDKQRNGRIHKHDSFLLVFKIKIPKYRYVQVISMEIKTGRSVKYRKSLCLLNPHIKIIIIIIIILLTRLQTLLIVIKN
jgi:hypothetical protein